MDELSPEANESQSVNTIYSQNGKLIGHNTDISGFELGIKYSKYDVKNKIVFILGAGGVVSSIIIALKKWELQNYYKQQNKIQSRRFKSFFNKLEIVD